MDLTVDIGLERIQRAIATIVINGINAALDAQDSTWAARDAAWIAATGRPDPGFTLEHISANNVYSGTIPSLIQSPESNFPNCSVIAYIANPINRSSDWTETYSCTVALEFMVKHLTSEEVVNTRIQRTLEAAHTLLLSDENRRIPELGSSLVPQISSKPIVTISDVFVRHQSGDPNQKSFYQHGSLTYLVDKFSTY